MKRTLFVLMMMVCAVMMSCNPTPDDGNDLGNGTSNIGEVDGHEYVDLGLPSGLKWATCNVGATSPEEYGDYFAWGEIEAKDEYTAEKCSTYGVVMNDISGNVQYDAASANWGESWRMPTRFEYRELLQNTKKTWTTQNGVNGYSMKSTINGDSIFFPAAGYRYGLSFCFGSESEGNYWCSTPIELEIYVANNIDFSSADYVMSCDYRFYGRTIRPVVK